MTESVPQWLETKINNRDIFTTELRVEVDKIGEYEIEVRPLDLLMNALENRYDIDASEDERIADDMSELDAILMTLNNYRQEYKKVRTTKYDAFIEWAKEHKYSEDTVLRFYLGKYLDGMVDDDLEDLFLDGVAPYKETFKEYIELWSDEEFAGEQGFFLKECEPDLDGH